MPRATVRANHSRLYAQADRFRVALEANEQAAADQMLAAWTDTYRGLRTELDALVAQMQSHADNGGTASLAWLYQGQRLQNLLAEARRQIVAYAQYAAHITEGTQVAAIRSAHRDAAALMGTAVAESLPGFAATFVELNPAPLMETVAGFVGDGTVLANHLLGTLPSEVVNQIRATLLHGVTTGKSVDWMVREVTRGYALGHARAVTIMRTESLRAYRETTRRTYEANPETVTTWVWKAHRDSACCIACIVMDGTEHPTSVILDGHPRCRCAMLPRTPSWEDLGITGLPDTRPPLDPGKAWLEHQSAAVQEALMGPLKYTAWRDGTITLDDMVARKGNPTWGTMRTERSMVAIKAGRDANWWDEMPSA